MYTYVCGEHDMYTYVVSMHVCTRHVVCPFKAYISSDFNQIPHLSYILAR